MKYLPKFDYIVSGNLEELCKLLQCYGDDARILAGGTDLLLNLKKGDSVPKIVVDISRIPELSTLRDEGSHIFIGATATHTDLAESKLIRGEVPFLSEAAESVGSVQIRNAGTIGGNIVNASPAADTIPPLLALDAEALIVSYKGERQIPLANLFSGPYKTILSPHEFLAGVRFAKLTSGAGSYFLKLGRRRALSISRISIAVVLVFRKDERIEDVRICPGAVMPLPSRMVRAEQTLIGFYPHPDLFEEAGKRVAREIVEVTGRRPSTPYKEPVIKNLVQRALAIAAARCTKK
jgi:CO/xanthine dehydrogenase FAD-binding subunit